MNSNFCENGYQVSIDVGESSAVRIVIRHQRDAMGPVGIQVDPGDVSMDIVTGKSQLVTLEQEVSAVVVLRIRPFLILQNQIRVLIGLCFRGFGLASRTGGDHRTVVVVAVEGDQCAGIFQRVRTLRHDRFEQFG